MYGCIFCECVDLICTNGSIALFVSALYFPQSDLSVKIPYLRNGIRLNSDINLITLRTLRNDSTLPDDAVYQILPSREKFATIDSRNGSVALQALPKGGEFNNFIKYVKSVCGSFQ